MTEFLTTPQGRRIACERRAGRGPGVVFLHGFNSDMRGTKAEALAAWAAGEGRALLRLDLSGHGESGGRVVLWGDEWITFDSDWQGFADVQKFWSHLITWVGPSAICGKPTSN